MNRDDQKPVFDPQLIRRFDVSGPRYTSYPTADRFHERFTAPDLIRLLEARSTAEAGKPLSLYFHIPFCDTVCYYCACNKIVTKDRSRAQTYLADLREDPSRGIEREERRRILDRALDSLTPGLRAVFVLRDVEGRSTAETADSPYTLTLGQVFNDGDWLRISLMLTSEDDSLAGFNAIGPREDAVEKALQNGGGQYGTLVLDNGIELSGGISFEKRDEHTFVAGLNYELFLTHDDLAGHTATLTLSNLMACNRSTVETDGKSYWHYDYADQTPLPGTYTLTFTIPEVSDAGVRTMSTPVEQDGVTLQSIKATPAATKVLLTFPPEQHWVSVKLYTADGTELGHERGEGGWWTDGAWTADPADFDHPEQCTKASYDYFAAVPENCHSLTVKVYDFDTDAELTTFTAELP